MDAEYGRRYAALFREHWWWRAREVAVLDEIERIRRGRPATTILDVGCGDGLLFDQLSAYGAVEGVEPDARLVTPGMPRPGVIATVSFDDRFAPPGQYGLILFLDVLEHMADPIAALLHARRLLHPGGAVVVTVPAFNWLWTAHDDLNHHVTRFSRAEFAAVASAAGFRIVRHRYLFQWLVPAKLLVRVVERLWGAVPKSPSVPPRPINNLLLCYCRLEHRMTKLLKAPFGSSFLAVLASAEDIERGVQD